MVIAELLVVLAVPRYEGRIPVTTRQTERRSQPRIGRLALNRETVRILADQQSTLRHTEERFPSNLSCMHTCRRCTGLVCY